MEGKRQPNDNIRDSAVDELKSTAEVAEFVEDGHPHAIADFNKKEAALRRKLDWYIAPVMMMCMLISYLDRGNIGFAASQGMTTEIGLTGNQLNASPLKEPIPFVTHHTNCILRKRKLQVLINLFTDRCLNLLCHLCPCRVSYFHIRQEITIQPSHTDSRSLLGTSLYVLWFCPEFCRSSCY